MSPFNPNPVGGEQGKISAKISPTENIQSATKPNNSFEEDANAPYLEERKVTISLTHNYSVYRKVNLKAMGHRKDTIGSSITSCRTLLSNQKEIEIYFPSIVGLSPSHPDFVGRVRAWLNNIQFIVQDNDVTLDTSFEWNHKKDYIAFKRREAVIDEEYSKIDRSDVSAIEKGVSKRITAINSLESEKCQYGRPVNVEDYLMYRHCLLYKPVAKDTALINSDPSYRFYIKDEAKEAEKKKRFTEERVKAMNKFIELNASPSKFNAVYIAICVTNGKNIAESLVKDLSEKQTIVMDFVNNNPDKFNKLNNDKNIILKAFIETLISRGELVRAEYNQQISTAEGEFIGSNINEAVAYFNNPEHKALYEAYQNKLKLF